MDVHIQITADMNVFSFPTVILVTIYIFFSRNTSLYYKERLAQCRHCVDFKPHCHCLTSVEQKRLYVKNLCHRSHNPTHKQLSDKIISHVPCLCTTCWFMLLYIGLFLLVCAGAVIILLVRCPDTGWRVSVSAERGGLVQGGFGNSHGKEIQQCAVRR